jgi:hypothetical protein
MRLKVGHYHTGKIINETEREDSFLILRYTAALHAMLLPRVVFDTFSKVWQQHEHEHVHAAQMLLAINRSRASYQIIRGKYSLWATIP